MDFLKVLLVFETPPKWSVKVTVMILSRDLIKVNELAAKVFVEQPLDFIATIFFPLLTLKCNNNKKNPEQIVENRAHQAQCKMLKK